MTRYARMHVPPALAALFAVAACQTPDRNALTVQVALQDDTPSVAKGTIVVDYSRAGAKVLSEEGGPACAFILPGVDGTFSDDGRGSLTARVQSKRGLRGPADVIACRMVAAKSDATPSDIRQRLEVRLTEAEDSAGKVLDLTIPVAKARRAAPATAPTAASAEAAATEAAAAGEMLADVEAKKAKAEPAKPVPPKPVATVAAPPKPPAPAPPVAPPAVRPPPPSPSGPANAPGSLNRSVINNPALSAADRARAFPDYGNSSTDTADTGTRGSSGIGNEDDDFDDSPSDDEAAPAFEVTVNVSAAETLGALQFQIIYEGDSGGWAGRGPNVICEALTDGLAAANYVGKRAVKLGLVSLEGIKSGAVVKCVFRSPERVTASSFTVSIEDASNLETDPLKAVPKMWVSNVVPI
ncbi:MAG TPA: hypothetical protein VEL28_05010 [Candidatus Binatia bacterium]|nr:hypothetical protein [Candidatus Binatia bacterium]